MSDFGTMKARIGAETLRTDTTNLGYIGSEILTAISHYGHERSISNEEVTTLSTVASNSWVTLPTDFLDLDHLKITIGGSFYDLYPMPFTDIESADQNTHSGLPVRYALYDESIRLYPTPDAVYTLTLAYTKDLTALSDDTDTNDWMTRGEALIRARAEASFKIAYLYDESAKQEAMNFAMRDEPFLSAREKSAYNAFRSRANKYISSGQQRASGW